MNKKEARRKKHEREKKKRGILDSEIIGAEEEEAAAEVEEEEETLLGNLAPVKEIPMISLAGIPAFPTFNTVLPVPDTPWMAEWIKLFEETAANEENDLLGIAPQREPDLKTLLPPAVGIAVQIREVEKTSSVMTLLHLKGICRYETLAIRAFSSFFRIKVRWFEDDFEPDEIVKPHFYKHLETIERIARMVGDSMKLYYNVSRTQPYNYRAAQYGSYTLLGSFDLFSLEEQVELLKLTSTSERLRRVNERAKEKLPEFEKKERARRKGFFN